MCPFSELINQGQSLKFPKKDKFPGAQDDILKLHQSNQQSKTNRTENQFTIIQEKQKQMFTFEIIGQLSFSKKKVTKYSQYIRF